MWHVRVGETSANENYKDLAFELPAQPIQEGYEFLRDALLPTIKAKFKGAVIPNPFQWETGRDGLTKEQTVLLSRRDQLIKEITRWL